MSNPPGLKRSAGQSCEHEKRNQHQGWEHTGPQPATQHPGVHHPRAHTVQTMTGGTGRPGRRCTTHPQTEQTNEHNI